METPGFGDLLRYHRIASGLTQEALAERAGLSPLEVSHLERGRRLGPRLYTVAALAGALRLSPAQIATLEGAANRRRRLRPIKTLRPPGVPPTDTAILGREPELAVLPFLLRQPDIRLLTLVGPAGVGKTRLALEVALRAAGSFPDGLTWVDLSPLKDAHLVLPTIAVRLGLRLDAESLIERLVEHLRSRDMLLVLDNLEQLLTVAPLLQELLAGCPNLRVLATSRVALSVPSEQAYGLDPLTVPPLEERAPKEIGEYAAVALFLERAGAVAPGIALTADSAPIVAALCRRLDGLPLAIELAAALARLMPPEVMLARLGADRLGAGGAARPTDGATLDLLESGSWDRPDRQQTMRQAIGWSYQLLNRSEQEVFRGLGVFTGGWLPGAAAAVLAMPAETVSVVLAALSAKHLVRVLENTDGMTRFGMLETIREYAAERLMAAADEVGAVRDRHIAWCATLVEAAELQLTGSEQNTWLTRLDREHENLRSALNWAQERKDAEGGLRIAGALWRYWTARGYYEEGRETLRRILTIHAASSAPAAVRAKALNAAANLAFDQGDFRQSAALNEEALALRRQSADKMSLANTLNNLGNAVASIGDLARAVTLHEEGLALRRELDDKWGIAASLNNLGSLAVENGDYGRAAVMHEDALAIRRELGDILSIAGSLRNLGNVAAAQGQYESATTRHAEALALRRAFGDKKGIADSLQNLGNVAAAQGDFTRAATIYRECLLLSREVGAQSELFDSLEGLAWVAAAGGESRRAAQLSGGAEAIRQAIGTFLLVDQRDCHERAVRTMRAALGEEEFAAAWAEGLSLPMEEVIALALGEPESADG